MNDPSPAQPQREDPAPTASGRPDLFPQTLATWIGQKIDEGDLKALNHHVMNVYAEPLQIYFRGCSLRWLGDAVEIVHEFFADRLGRDDYIRGWPKDRMKLRRYLINGFWLYLRERMRKHKRSRDFEEMAEEPPAVDDDIERDFDRAFVQSVVRQALSRGEEACRRDEVLPHWQVFIRHVYEQKPYREIAVEMGIPPDRAAVMCRTASRRFEQALREIIARDADGQDRVRAEISSYLEIIES